MLGRRDRTKVCKAQSANDNEAFGFAAGEGVVHCLHFLASEAEHLGYASAAEISLAAFALQAEIQADREASDRVGGKIRPQTEGGTTIVAALAPGA